MDETKHDALELYIGYQDFLSADQLAAMISAVNDLYNALYPAYDPEVAFHLPPESRLRINQCQTGSSVSLEFIEGVRQVWSTAGPVLQITGGFGIVLTMGRLLIAGAKGFVELRKLWFEGTEKKLNAEKLKRELEQDDENRASNPEHTGTPEFPATVKRRVAQAISNFYITIEYAPNIDLVQINGETIKGNGHLQGRG